MNAALASIGMLDCGVYHSHHDRCDIDSYTITFDVVHDGVIGHAQAAFHHRYLGTLDHVSQRADRPPLHEANPSRAMAPVSEA